MLPKFANPHLLTQDAELTTRSEISGRVFVGDDEDSRSLKRDLDNLLQNMWADVLAESTSLPKPKKRRKTAESQKIDSQPVFRLVSSTKRPQYISLDPKPPPPPPVTREPECEDDEIQAEVRRIRAQSAAVDLQRAGTDPLMGQKPVSTETKVLLVNTPFPQRLPPLLATEEVRMTKRVRTRDLESSEASAPSPHEPRLSCVVLPVKSVPDGGKAQRKRRRKIKKERPAPAYWRPSPGVRGRCMGYALGYPSSWAPNRLYVRDVMKRGVLST